MESKDKQAGIDSAKVGDIGADTMIANASLLISIYQAPTGQILWKSSVGDKELENILKGVLFEVSKHNMITDAVAASLKAVKEIYGSELLGPGGKPILRM